MAGIKGRSGRKKVRSRLIAETLERVAQSSPQLFKKLLEKALNGDKDALIYLIDQRLGHPYQSIGQRIKLKIGLTADDYAMERLKAQEIGQKLVEQFSPDLLSEKASD